MPNQCARQQIHQPNQLGNKLLNQIHVIVIKIPRTLHVTRLRLSVLGFGLRGAETIQELPCVLPRRLEVQECVLT